MTVDVYALPASFAQQRLWFLDQVQPNSAAYNLGAPVRLSGHLDSGALRASLNEVVRRHESLRTQLATVDGRPTQVILPDLTISLPVIDLSGLPASEREQAVRQRALEEMRRPFDLARAPLIRATLLRLGNDEHLLLLNMHHIISDGWSVGVLVKELGSLYQALLNGQPSPLPELPIQYADFAVWQEEWLRGPVLEELLDYWRQRLESLPVLQLATDWRRPAVQTDHGARVSMPLPPELTDSLRALSRENVTLFMTLLAAFQTLLHRCTGQDDIVVGTPVANRDRPEVAGLIGFFVDLLVVRADLAGNPTFRELLGRVRDVALGAYTHQQMPFEKLVKEIQPHRDRSRSPLFQVLFASEEGPPPPLRLGNLRVELLDVDPGTAKYDVSLTVADTGHGLRAVWEYNTDLFEQATISRMAEHFRRLLDGIAAEPGRRLSDLPLLSAPERYQLLIEWNATDAPIPEKTLHQLIEEQAGRTPDRVALACDDTELTYRELESRANRLASRLRSVGVGPEVRVAVCLDRSPELLIGLLGILKAGGAYVPLDPAYPRERLAFMLTDAQVSVLLTQKSLADLLPATGAKLIGVDDEQGPTEELSDAANVGPDGLAYVIYTSGSTGKPKGVEVTHRSVVNFLHSMRERPGLTDADVLVAVTHLSFDIAGLELFLPLMVGARLVLAGPGIVGDGRRLASLLEKSAATVMQATPVTWRLLLGAGWPAGIRLQVWCGGETLPRDLADRLLEKADSVWNLYGPTETTIWSTIHRVQSGEDPVPIGRPIANTQAYILDATRQPVPLGVAGELYIGGVGVARGYLGRPETTAERFVPDPFRAGGRLYRTGDGVRYGPDGVLLYLGRLDEQVKLRGFRIEPGEIEAALCRHPAIRQAAVVIWGDSAEHKRLVAYFVADGNLPTATDLRNFLRDKLPAPLIPASFVQLRELPLTPNRKVDRRALPSPDSSLTADEEYQPPRDEDEEQLASIIAGVLHLERVGIHDSFFDLGGASVEALEVSAQAQQAGIPLTPELMFEHPTVAELAEAIRQVSAAPADSIPTPSGQEAS